MARLALRELQQRCFAMNVRSRRSLFFDGHLCLDRRREFMLELCGQEQPIRLPKGLPRYWQGRGPRAFAVASRRRRGGGLEPFLFRTYKAIPAKMGERRKRKRAIERVERKALEDAVQQWEEQELLLERRRSHKAAQRGWWPVRWWHHGAAEAHVSHGAHAEAASQPPKPPLSAQPTSPPPKPKQPQPQPQRPLDPEAKSGGVAPSPLRWVLGFHRRLQRRQRMLVAAKDRFSFNILRALKRSFDEGLPGTSDAQMWQAMSRP